MIVLMDIEWVENRQHHVSPTQLAALRVDGSWQKQALFYSRIRPRDGSFYHWNHVAYTGGDPAAFLYARGLYEVLQALKGWLCEDDVLCFWHVESQNVLKSVWHLLFREKLTQRMVILGDRLDGCLAARGLHRGTPYQLCAACGTDAPGPKHHAQQDVFAMRQALVLLHCPASVTEAPVRAPSSVPRAESVAPALRPYQYDTAAGLFHRRSCPDIPADAPLIGHPDLQYFFRKRLTPCPRCMKSEARAANRARNRDIIDRTEYRFVFAASSPVFHRRSCGLILGTTGELRGALYYRTCEESGRRPCRVCHPAPEASERPSAPRPAPPRPAAPKRTLSHAEKQAMARFQQAKAERYAGTDADALSPTQRNDFFTLTQPRFAFFAARGYATFHRRECSSLRGLSDLRGFSRFDEACRAGLTPCRHCKPSARQDILCAVPITSRERPGESAAELTALCQQYGYPCAMERKVFSLSTPVGRWRIRTDIRPYTIRHINLVKTPEGTEYHQQPRLFLSLLDCFFYILRHDQELAARTTPLPPADPCESAG